MYIKSRTKGTGRLLAMILALFLLSGCSQEEETSTSDKIIEELELMNEGHFMGVSLGDPKDSVLDRERSGELLKEKTKELQYRIPLGTEKAKGYCKVYYTFDHLGLFEIQADIHLNDEGEMDDLITRLKVLFKEKYGESRNEMGYTTWSRRGRNGNELEVSLIKNELDGKTFISLNFFQRIKEDAP